MPKKRGYGKGGKFAKALGVTPQRVSQYKRAGMPMDSIDSAKRWVAENMTRRTGEVAGSTQRLRAAQAERAELENAETRGALIDIETVRQVASAACVAFSSQLRGMPSRLAGELAAMTDPAMIRQRMLDETRRILATVAAEFRGLALEPHGGPAGAAAGQDAGSVGRSNEVAATG